MERHVRVLNIAHLEDDEKVATTVLVAVLEYILLHSINSCNIMLGWGIFR